MFLNAQIVLIFLFALLLRWCVTYHSYSGQKKPPMFGDYEAQRHWQEVTVNLPIDKWYINSTKNDLEYWGLDYPPLTAYHSLLLGFIANSIEPSYVKLHDSRGFSSSDHKYFMRLTVACADALVYIPAMIYFIMNLHTLRSKELECHNIYGIRKKDFILLSSLIYPGLILIDHGHFQYNCVSLGFFVGAVAAILKDFLGIGSFLFVLALNYKQMELYHALPFFCYILGKSKPNENKTWFSSISTLAYISFIVIGTSILIWLPFLKNYNTFIETVLRLFPFSRGVFEDKVANLWCTINIFYKLRNVYTNSQLAKICLVITMVAVLPCSISLYLNPNKDKFVIALINSALAFFLFSFQVHEKSILLVAIPVLLHFHNDPLPCFWFLLVSHFSMLPLFIKDDLYLAYFATAIFYILSIFCMWPDICYYKEPKKYMRELYKGNIRSQERSRIKKNTSKSFHSKIKFTVQRFPGGNLLLACLNFSQNFWIITLFYSSVLGMLLFSIGNGFLKPPEKYPDLFALLISVYSCFHFLIFFFYFNYKQFIISNKSSVNKVKLR